MGKYMRKCRGAAGEEVAAVEVTQVVGVRTRSRSSSAAAGPAVAGGVVKVAPKRRKALPPATELAGEPAAVGAGGDGASCYLQLRSRTLFKASPSVRRATKPEEAAGAGHGAVLEEAAGLSRCSSTASSVDASAQERSAACRSEAAEAGGYHIPEGSATNSGSGRDRERREMTPSSRAHGEVSDLESDLAWQKSGRSLPATTSAVRPMMPPAAEIEEFFAAAEEARAKSFASKYNFAAPGTGYVRRNPMPADAAKPRAPAQAAAAAAPVALRKPVFTTVDQLRPQTHGHTLTARVLSARTVLDKASPQLGRTRVAECLVGDHTGTILVTARNQQIDLVKPGTTVIFRNAKIDMFKGTMRLAVDKWGRIEVTEGADFQVKEDNNMSLVEYELVDVEEED